nr:immunoglobulin light chain junction region [Macaca mulatta]
CLQSHDSPTF